MWKILGIAQENNGFGFHAGFGANLFHRHPPDPDQGNTRNERFTPGARAFARLPRGIVPALFLAYKVVLE
jgi:hypothetical protein